jgi:hypothetical protein
MTADPQVKSAIAHWGPRFVANGVVLTDFEEVTGALKSYDDWCAAWSARAAHHEQHAREEWRLIGFAFFFGGIEPHRHDDNRRPFDSRRFA